MARPSAPRTPQAQARADALETSDGVLEFARVDGLDLRRDRSGRVLVSLGCDPRASVLLEPDAVARLRHALACSAHPYGVPPVTDDEVETAREHLSRVHGVNLPAKIIASTLEAARGA